MKEIKYEDFKKLNIKIGLVKDCSVIPNTENLYKMMVDCGEQNLRQVVTGMRKFYSPKDFMGEKIVILTNLESREIMGVKSEGMILAADVNGKPVLLKLDPNKENMVPAGTKIK
jgi:methionine--tRNA ligase beta chain